MMSIAEWVIAEPTVDAVLSRHDRPLEELAAGNIPAIVLRGAYSSADCEGLMQKFIREGHLYDPAAPVPEKFLERSIPEGNFRKARSTPAESEWRDDGKSPKRRIDIGSSLGNLGFDKERFLNHSKETHALFEHLFDPYPNPVHLLYRTLEDLANGLKVRTAQEPDGRRYGPAIFRAHYGGYTYKPHFDSVRLREDRRDYAVYHFEHQFAGVLVLQNSEKGGQAAQCILHRRLWDEEVNPHLEAGSFHDYASRNRIENVTVNLNPGDLYFFNTRSIHEVPGVDGHLPRVVLATFIGYTPGRDLAVWS